MPDKPAAEVPIDEPLVRRLVHAQASHLIPPDARIVHVDEGWDCSVWRVGASHAARLPRRAAAVEPTTNEQR
ncbi:MAG TPA: hypothetical protein VJR25_13130, partial [Microbacterium sp.]|nr:hypothetical protein [Microbacterium sp.]